jgi:hypothetical protein
MPVRLTAEIPLMPSKAFARHIVATGIVREYRPPGYSTSLCLFNIRLAEIANEIAANPKHPVSFNCIIIILI